MKRGAAETSEEWLPHTSLSNHHIEDASISLHAFLTYSRGITALLREEMSSNTSSAAQKAPPAAAAAHVDDDVDDLDDLDGKCFAENAPVEPGQRANYIRPPFVLWPI